MRIPWTAWRTNEEVWQMARGCRELLTVIRRRQIGFIGHILKGSGLERECLLGIIEGRRARGRQRLKYMDSIKELVGCGSMSEVMRLAEDRSVWRYIAANVNLDTTLR